MMKTILSVLLFISLISIISMAWADPYRDSSFPKERVLEKYTGKNYRFIGKWQNDDGIYFAYGFYESKDGTEVSDYLGMFIRLDNNYWMQRKLETEPWQVFDPDKNR